MKVSEDQRQAMVAWKKVYGVRWRQHLMNAWINADYPGVNERYAAILQGLRNSGSFGPKQLRNYTLERT